MSEIASESYGPLQWRGIERDDAALEAAIKGLRASGLLRELNGTDDLIVGLSPIPDEEYMTRDDFHQLEDGDRY